eukprot:824476-Pleurochrysis_carterae.AAC.6
MMFQCTHCLIAAVHCRVDKECSGSTYLASQYSAPATSLPNAQWGPPAAPGSPRSRAWSSTQSTMLAASPNERCSIGEYRARASKMGWRALLLDMTRYMI